MTLPDDATRRARLTARIRLVAGFRPVDPKQSFPELEERILERWRERDVFHRSLTNRESAPLWGFYDGPPTANGRPRRAPRSIPGLQGHLPALPHDDRQPGPSQGRLGLPRPAGRARGRARARHHLEGGDRGLRDRRVQRALPRIGLPLRRGVEPPDRADRSLDRSRRPLRDDDQRVHRVGLVGAAPDLGRRAALRGLQGRALLPARRDRALLARGRPRLPRRRGPLGLREAAGPAPAPSDAIPESRSSRATSCSSGPPRPGR